MNFTERIAPQIRHTDKISTIQVNLGKICNLACSHCHVEAGPKRTETMSKETLQSLAAHLR